MHLPHLFDDISFDPLREDLAAINGRTLRQDLSAGITVALLTLPQTMAYALMAGLPLSCGLYAAIFSAMIASAWGSSRHLIFGPSNAVAILIQVGTSEILFTHFRHLAGADRDLMALQLLTQLTLLVAFFQAGAAAFRLGNLTRFVSQPVVVAYLMGVACAVVVTQLYTFTGIPAMPGVHSVYDKGVNLFANLGHLHLSTFLVGLASIGMILGLKRYNPRLPAGALMLVAVSFVVNIEMLLEEGGFWGLTHPMSGPAAGVILVGDTGILNGEGAGLQMPYFNIRIMSSMLPFAFAVAVLGILEASSVARSLATRSRQAVSTNQEIFALCLGNMVSAFTGAMPISGSPTRTALNFGMGAKSRFSGIFSAFCVALLVGLFGSWISMVPLAALAALLIVSVRHLIDVEQIFFCLKATRSDAFVMAATLFSCIVFSLDTAFYVGVVLSVTLYLRKAAVPQVAEWKMEDGQISPVLGAQTMKGSKIRLVKVEGELFFGAADLFQSSLRAFAHQDVPTRVLVLQLRNARDMDATACLALRQLHDYLSGMGRHLVLSGMTPEVMHVIIDSGLAKRLGPENLFPFDGKAHHLHMQKSMARANELIALEKELVVDSSVGDEELYLVEQGEGKFASQEALSE